MESRSLESPVLFDRQSLVRLILPLLIEQVLAVTMGLVDTIMVSALSQEAISSVSLVDNINLLMSQLFTALATGGAVIAAQYLGHRDRANACDTARQLVQVSLGIALVIMAVVLLLNRWILRTVFGNIDETVMTYAISYFAITALSYPFLALYNAGAALFRAMGNSKISMWTALMMNVVHIAGNFVAIYGLGWGVAGVGVSTLVSRILSAVMMLWMITRYTNPIFIPDLHRIQFRWANIKRILSIGIPNGLENSIFQVGKLLVMKLVSVLGTSAIAANAISNTLSSIVVIPGSACSLALITVVGQCMGAEQPDQAVSNTKKIMIWAMVSVFAVSAALFAFLRPVIGIFNLQDATAALAHQVMFVYCIVTVVFWAPSFSLPNALRGAGDAKYTLIVSMISMWVFRIGFSYLLVRSLSLQGIWCAMYVDWVFRSLLFVLRFRGGRWRSIRVI
ncbi:MAG TPA: MATE family efflux transporter [Clostridia bacterium]|nr:MATE family efflux transporter [Clostridia bacterium]